jgi:hypothetical protein
MRRLWRHSRPGGRTSFSKTRVAAGLLAFFLTFVLVVGVLVYTAPEHSSLDTPFNDLRSVSALEMPDRAVRIVQAGAPARQDELIQESLKAVSILARPGILPYTVSALARQFPDRLEAILGAAMDLQPDLVLVYARSCIVQQPSRAEQISYVLGKKSPWNAPAIARILSAGTPDSDAIIRGLQKGIPEYHPQDHLFDADHQATVPSPSADTPPASPVGCDQQAQ